MYQNFTRKTVIIVCTVVFLWLTTKYLLPIFLPFALGAFLAAAADPTVQLLHRKLRFPRPAATAVAVSGVFVLLTAVVMLLSAVLLRQLGRLGDLLPEIAQAVTQGSQLLQQALLRLLQRIPGELPQSLSDWVATLFSGGSALLEQVSSRLPRLATGLVGWASQGLFGIVTGVISGFMISCRLPNLRQWLAQKVPNRIHESYLPALQGLRKALSGWILAQLKLAGVAAVLLTIGFYVLGITRPILWAGLSTLVDAFPVLGVGTVLLPWSVVCFLQGETFRALGLLAIYIVVWLIRSILEPKLIGKELGIDPLLTLVAMYAGFRLLGIAGLLLSPLMAMTITQTVRSFPR